LNGENHESPQFKILAALLAATSTQQHEVMAPESTPAQGFRESIDVASHRHSHGTATSFSSLGDTDPGRADKKLMPAAYFAGDGSLMIQPRPMPTPRSGEILLQTVVSALCGTDLHRFRGARSYGSNTDVFGHESVALVMECASGEFRPGDLVLHVPYPNEGRVFAPYQLARATNVLPLPHTLNAETAVFAQQLGTVIYALMRFWTSSTPPVRAFVAGAGPAGLLFIQMLRLMGCEQIYVSEPNEHRRRLAVSFGATCADETTVEVDLSIDASGAPGVRHECWLRTKPHGTLGIYGLPDDEPGDLEVSVLGLLAKNLHLVGAIGSQSEPGLPSFLRAIDLLASRHIEVGSLISHRIALNELPRTVPLAVHVTDDVVKVLVRFPTESAG
jgi:L-iditol 2-dehydrogenase